MMPKSRRMLLSPKHLLRLATWNVRTMYQMGKCAQVVNEMQRLRLEILGVSETRWTGAGEVRSSGGETFLYSGSADEDAPHEKGVGLFLSQLAYNSLMEWEPVSERILSAKFKTKCQNTTIVQIYAPTELADADLKDEFYSMLQATINKISRRDIVILMGDFNAKVGRRITNGDVMGGEGLGEQNDNGERLVDFCATNGLVIGGTLFPHKTVHKVTWMSPDGFTENQIDHIAISRRWRSSLQDTRTMRSADVGSDHHLVLAKVKIKMVKQIKAKGPRKKYCVEKLKDPSVQEAFKIKLSNKFSVLSNLGEDEENVGSVEETWTKIKDTYISTCEEILGKKIYGRKEWISDETWKLVEERRSLKENVDKARTRGKKAIELNKYREKDREVKRGCRRDKRKQIEEKTLELEHAAENRDTAKVYKVVKDLSGRRMNQEKPVKDKQGNTITKLEDQLNRWREHFQEILNRRPPEDPPTFPMANEELEISTEQISKAEIRRALKKMKSGKAAGIDNIPPEAWKAGEEVSVDAIHELFIRIWDEETIPHDWKKGLLVKLPKKGDTSQCKNWRGIMLLVIAQKIMSRVIYERIKGPLEGRLRDEQAGFRAERSCCDQIATLRILIEQSLEWNSGLYMTFVDFEKAFDSVDRASLWGILGNYGVPKKIVNMIQLTYNGFQARVIHGGALTEGFGMDTGVMQGDLLSPLLFLLALDWITRESFNGSTGVQWTLTEKLEDLEFADDLCLVSQKISHMRQKVDNLRRNSAKLGLKINVEKTKEMRVKTPVNTGCIRCGDDTIAKVDNFRYLGSIVAENGGSEEDIAMRKRSAQHVFVCLKNIWRARNISLKTKMRIFNASVKTVLLYGSETWKSTKGITSGLQAFVNRKLRYIAGIWWPQKIKNEDLLKLTKQEKLVVTITRQKWKWIGHTLKKPTNSTTRRALEWNPQGGRRKGRPQHSWRRTLEEELKSINSTWSEAKKMAQDRDVWRALVLALCSKVGSGED